MEPRRCDKAAGNALPVCVSSSEPQSEQPAEESNDEKACARDRHCGGAFHCGTGNGASGVRVGPFGVGVGPGPYYYDNCGYWNNWCNGPYYDYYGGPNVVIGGPGWHHWHHWHHWR